MNRRTVKLIDRTRTVIASAQMADEDTHCAGTVDLASTPPVLRALFDEFEEAVNDQMFSIADEVQTKISAFGIQAIVDDGYEADVKDLQVFPGTGNISFKLVVSPARAAKSA